jgi:predicted Zn finger-like uncharacterized protein
MILQCPACDTRFLVDASLIPAEGREVKCARCKHVWHVNPEDNGSELEYEEIIETESEESDEDLLISTIEFEDSNKETIRDQDFDLPLSPHVNIPEEKSSSAGALALLTTLLLIAVMGLSMMMFRDMLQPVLGPVYSLIGLTPTDGLSLADVSFRERPSRDKARFIVEGHIVNEASEPRQVPILRVAIADAQGEWILSREYEAEGVILQPGESYPFKATQLDTTFADRVDHLVVDIGSGTELMLRK